MEQEQLILGIVIILLSIGMTVFAIAKKPFSNFIDYIIAFLGVLLVLLATTNMTMCNNVENFTDTSTGIGRMLSVLSIKNAATTAISGSTLTQGSQSTNAYNENLNLFVRNLTVYYSAFSSASFPNSNRRWFNISPYFSSPQSVCPDVSMDDTSMFFLEIPSYSRDNGFSLGVNKIIGPQSYQLGFSANDAFTMFFTLKFNEFAASDDILEIFKFFANTSTNNGMSLYINNDYSVNNEVAHINMFFTFGTFNWPLTLKSINMAYVYFFVITKSGHNIAINVYPNIGDISSSPSFSTQVLKATIDPSTDILLSNKEMVMNSYQNLQANIFNFGIYNRDIPDHTIADLYTNIQTEIQKSNQLLLDLAATITNLQNQLASQGQCPYDTTTCGVCSGIADWTNISSIILGATPDCLAAINSYCTKHPTSTICSCWNPQNILSKTDQCRNYVGIFSGKSCVTSDSVDPQTLAVIKQKYALCDCGSVAAGAGGSKSAPGGSASASTLVPSAKAIIVPAPKLIDNVFNYNATDVDLYNSINAASMTPSKNAPNRMPSPSDNTSFTSVLTNFFK